MMQKSIAAFPEFMQKEMEKSMRQMLEHGLTAKGQAIVGSTMAEQTNSLLKNMAEGLEGQKNKTPIEIHFYHCDHLGTPIALTDKQGQIVWAAKYDPWGNIEEEYNPHNIEQNIRLPGQHHDRETGLYYNRHRYYDPTIGAFINQDPIGLKGGVNLYAYPKNPVSYTDPKGLSKCYMPSSEPPTQKDNITGTAINAAGAAARTAIGRATPIGTAVSAIRVTGEGLVQAMNMEACREEAINKAEGIQQPVPDAVPRSTEPPLTEEQRKKIADRNDQDKCWKEKWRDADDEKREELREKMLAKERCEG
jgi:RHS repeat-associated protein